MCIRDRLNQVRCAIRTRHYSLRTEQSYVAWILRFIRFHGTRHPSELGAPEIQSFLSHLATHRDVAASTQNQAFAAILFLYRDVLEIDLPRLDSVIRAKRPQRVPTVLRRCEIDAVIDHLSGGQKLMGQLLYGSGLRLMECLRLRVKDVDLHRREIRVRDEFALENGVAGWRMLQPSWRRTTSNSIVHHQVMTPPP